MNTVVLIVLGLVALAAVAVAVASLAAARRERERAEAADARTLAARQEAQQAGDRAVRAEALAEAARDAREQVGEAIKAASAEAAGKAADDLLKRAEESFVNRERLAQSRIETQLKPVADQLEKLTTHVAAVEEKRVHDTGGLKAQIEGLLGATTATQDEARRLSTALRRGAGVQGRWGEQMLDNVLEMSGLRRGVDYEEQVHVAGEEGAARPDVIVRLPGGGVFVIDSKVSLTDYLAVCQAGDDDSRAASLTGHLASIRRHVAQLSSKAYWSRFDKPPLSRSPDVVAMFVPLEGALACLADHHPSLVADAWSKKVAIVTPTALFPLLRAVAYGWRAEDQAANAHEIVEAGKELHKRVSVVAKYAADLGAALDKAVEKYNDFGGSLERNVLSQARRFEALSAQSDRTVVEPASIETRSRGLSKLAPPPEDAAA